MIFPSDLVEKAVEQISKLPGIGKKSALRTALFLLKKDPQFTHDLSSALLKLVEESTYCKHCHNISDADECKICTNQMRDKHTLCVVAGVTDVLAIEQTGHYKGLYFVLGNLISPIEGIGPDEINAEHLERRVVTEGIKEVILALSATAEGDTTQFYLIKKLKSSSVKVSTLAKGISVGSGIEYTDEVTLARSLAQRVSAE